MRKKSFPPFILGLFTLGLLLFLVLLGSHTVILGNTQNIGTGEENRSGNLIIPLCDGETQIEIEGAKAGEPLSPAKALKVAVMLNEAYAAQKSKQTSKWTKRDRMIWTREQKRMIKEGRRLFHDWKAIGGTTGISCDMCHPDASNTHPETYPKFQTQLKKVSTLRDMINWCIENPSKGKPLALDDPKMIALEAYITEQRKGAPLAPGKH